MACGCFWLWSFCCLGLSKAARRSIIFGVLRFGMRGFGLGDSDIVNGSDGGVDIRIWVALCSIDG